MFVSRNEYYQRNLRDGEALNARPAYLEGPNGREIGVGIFADNNPRFILREDHALALCNAIVDSLDKHRTGGKQTTPTN